MDSKEVIIKAWDWAPVTSGVPRCSVLLLFIRYINDIDLGVNNFIAKFADDTKIGNCNLRPRQTKPPRRFAQNLRIRGKCLSTLTNAIFFKWE